MGGRQSASWSLTLGRPFGVPLRLHFFFLLFAVLTVALTMDGLLVHGLMTLGVLFVSLLWHEAAHAFAAIRLGGRVDQIVIGPVGGLVAPRVPDEPEVQVFVALAGPIINLSLVVSAAAVLLLEGSTDVLGLLYPVVQVTDGNFLLVEGSYALVAVKMTLWLNWILMLVNLLPAYPFDGGPALRAMLWPILGRRSATVVTSRVAMGIAVGLLLVGFVWQTSVPYPMIPFWLPMLTLATFLFFSAKHDLAAAGSVDLKDEIAGYRVQGDGIDLLDELWSSEEEEDAVLVEQRNDRRRERQEQARRAQEQYEDARVDDILARLHEESIEALSHEELDLLQRASQRYRKRRRPSGDE